MNLKTRLKIERIMELSLPFVAFGCGFTGRYWVGMWVIGGLYLAAWIYLTFKNRKELR